MLLLVILSNYRLTVAPAMVDLIKAVQSECRMVAMIVQCTYIHYTHTYTYKQAELIPLKPLYIHIYIHSVLLYILYTLYTVAVLMQSVVDIVPLVVDIQTLKLGCL